MRKKRFTINYKAVFADTDSAGIVHFSNYFRFFERAEEAYLQHLGLSYIDLASKYKARIKRVKAYCEYLSTSGDGDDLQVTVCFERIKEKTIMETFEIKNLTEDKIAAKGELMSVFESSLDLTGSATIESELVGILLERD
jgi:acyl-CoA thioester hydrolase